MPVLSRTFRPIDLEKAREIAREKGLKPGMVTGTTILQFTKGKSERIDVIDWNMFEELMNEKQLQIYEYNGWMKIFRKE